MSRRLDRELPQPQSTEEWIRHFTDHHTVRDISPDDVRKYPGVLLQLLNDHYDLHVHFYCGHEHDLANGLVVPGRLK